MKTNYILLALLVASAGCATGTTGTSGTTGDVANNDPHVTVRKPAQEDYTYQATNANGRQGVSFTTMNVWDSDAITLPRCGGQARLVRDPNNWNSYILRIRDSRCSNLVTDWNLSQPLGGYGEHRNGDVTIDASYAGVHNITVESDAYIHPKNEHGHMDYGNADTFSVNIPAQGWWDSHNWDSSWDSYSSWGN